MALNGRGRQVIDVSSVFTGLAIIVVFLRMYTRFFIVRCAGSEDYIILLSMLFSIGLTICMIIQVRNGMGQHIWTLTNPVELQRSLKAFWVSILVYNLSLSFTKMSMLLQYRRVFPTKKFNIVLWSIFAVIVLFTIWTQFGTIFTCIPVEAFWTKDPTAKCMDQFAAWFTNAAFNIVTDLAIIILPMPVIRRLNLPRRQKQLLMGIFALGGFACIVSILRLHSLVAISNSEDPTYDNPPAATWSCVETNVGIISSCLPCLRPLLTRWFPRIFASGYTYGANSAQPYGRSACGRHSSGPGNVLGVLPTKRSGCSNDAESRDDGIQVLREFHVSVENGKRSSLAIAMAKDKEMKIEGERESSTETLVRDVKEVV